MMKTYLEDEEEALDGFEFLTMAEAGELGHWEIVQTMAKTVGDRTQRPSSPIGRSTCSAVTSTRCATAASPSRRKRQPGSPPASPADHPGVTLRGAPRRATRRSRGRATR